MGLDLQNGYDDYVAYSLETKKLTGSTINNVLASVRYFVENVAVDDYAKSINYKRVKQHEPDKQPVFPLEYHQQTLFDKFIDMFGGEGDLSKIAMFCYFAGLRIFEALKLKKRDLTFNKSDGSYSVLVKGKGEKNRMTFILDEHVVKYLNSALNLAKNDGSEYLFLKHIWEKQKPKDISQESFIAQQMGHTVGMKIKQRTGYPSHSLRRGFASYLCDIGCDDSTIQSCMGHSKFDTTLRYIDDNILLKKVRGDMKNKIRVKDNKKGRKIRKKIVTQIKKVEIHS